MLPFLKQALDVPQIPGLREVHSTQDCDNKDVLIKLGPVRSCALVNPVSSTRVAAEHQGGSCPSSLALGPQGGSTRSQLREHRGFVSHMFLPQSWWLLEQSHYHNKEAGHSYSAGN